MNDKQARGFLEDIVAHPDDNTPRLVFADWLEEQGDSARAEFIRVQIERVSLPEWDARQVRLRLREQELIDQYGQQWKAELPTIKGIRWEEFHRGFVATARVASYAALQTNASACWTATPIEAITVRWPRRREYVDGIKPIPGLRELSIDGNLLGRQEAGLLADAPLLSTLEALTVSDCSLGLQGFHRLLQSPHLGNLTALRVPFNSLGNGGVSALFDAVSLDSLEELDLSETGSYGRYGEDPIIEGDGLEELTLWTGMARLRSLTLSGNDVGRYGLGALLRSPDATGLKELVLRGNGLDGPAMEEFVHARPELRLEVLDLGENLLGDLSGAKHLANAPCLRELKVLELDRCEMSLTAARCLAGAPFLGSLRVLNVNHNSFKPEGLQALLDAKSPTLHTLVMVDNDLGDVGALRLAESPASEALLQLNLAHNGVGNHGAAALARSTSLRNLLVLRLYDNRFSAQAAAARKASPLGKRLMVLQTTDVTNEGD